MPGELADDVLELRLVTGPTAGFVGYLFAIHHRGADVDVGRIILRVDRDDPALSTFAGHIAFAIEPEHRGHGHARRACLLLRPLALRHGFHELWLTTAPDNIDSQRTIERLGAEYTDTAAIPPDSDMIALGLRHVRRYRWRL